MEPSTYIIDLKDIEKAAETLKGVSTVTPLMQNLNASKEHGATILLKREDLQIVRSYKIRGAYNKISNLSSKDLNRGIVCASAGNHAQGVAYSCKQKKTKGVVFMPTPTPQQKIEQVNMFGEEFVEIKLVGDTFDDAQVAAKLYCVENEMTFIPPFDDAKVIEGQGTIALEILEQTSKSIDYLFVPVGGGGLAAGVISVFKELSPNTKIIGVEPEGAPSMSTSINNGVNTKLDRIDKFVDGAAVQKVGNLNFEICVDFLDKMVTVPEGKICETILKLYNKDAIVVEPAGALTLAALDQFHNEIEGKNIVCLVSGSNNDIIRMEEIKERALLYSGLKHYFTVSFPQRSGALKEFLTDVLGPTDDITFFEFSKKHNREKAPAIIGLLLKNQADLISLKLRMNEKGILSQYLNDQPELLNILI
ncbi:MAG: threonine ammonia-lyase IlvA [Flavobacteriales bacterium]|jgi:threonine dehydratase|nr:threonine ammonia-lyase IlvA [Flavobacteriales bacterium]